MSTYNKFVFTHSGQICCYLNSLCSTLDSLKDCCDLTQQAAKYHLASCSFQPTMWHRREKMGGKNVKFVGWNKHCLIGQKKKITIMIKELECTKQVMHTAIAQQQPPASFPPHSHAELVAVWCRTFLWPVGVRCPACVPTASCALQHPYGWEKLKSPWCGVNVA